MLTKESIRDRYILIRDKNHIGDNMEPNEIPIDVKNLSDEAICDMVNQSFLNDGRSTGKRDYYVGITNNVEENRNRHHVPHIAVYECKDAETAAVVEEMLGKSFDVGKPPHRGNGGSPDSVYVYICYKSTDFRY